MSAAKHTPGPWSINMIGDIVDDAGHLIAESVSAGNRSLIANAPDLLKVLREAVDLAWIEDSHSVVFDRTVMFSPYYDFDSLKRATRQEFYGKYEGVVWPGRKWSAYCTYEGSMWFEQFETAEEAKEACMRLLDRVLPDHPAMKARAAIAKATGSKS